MHIIHYSDRINHLFGRHSTQSPSLSVALGGLMSTLSPESKGGPLICVILPPDVSIKRPETDVHYTTKSHTTQCAGSSLWFLPKPDSWVAWITGLQGYQKNKAFVITNACSQPTRLLYGRFFIIIIIEGTQRGALMCLICKQTVDPPPPASPLP